MVSSGLLAIVGGGFALAPCASAFDPQAKTNLAVYYGQGQNQTRLSHFCHETSLDIINLGFVNVFPDQGILGIPGTNFGNQCDGMTLSIAGVSTQFLTGCHQLAEDIPVCQAAGKKIFVSIGGGSSSSQKIESEASATKFADFLWDSFGPKSDKLTLLGSRPFGDAAVDGFDFDVEQNGGYGYATMVNRLRERFAEEPSRTFYISAAPQCPIPDPQLSDAIANAIFDFIWVQFYNTDGCSARNFVEGNGNPGFNYDDWVTIIKKSANPATKLLVGLPASTDVVLKGFYLTPHEVEPLVRKYIDLYPETFGGIMLWEATASDRNRVHGRAYADNMKRILTKYAPRPTPSSTSAQVHASTSVSSSYTPSYTPSSSSALSTAVTSSAMLSSPPTSSKTTPSVSSKPSSYSVTPSAPSVSSSTVASTPSSTPNTRLSSKLGSTTSSRTIISGRPTSSSSAASSAFFSSHASPPGAQLPTSSGPASTTTNSQTGPNGAPSTTGTESIAPSTVTTVVATSYIDICPTGFTTVTTTYTTTYCPRTAAPSLPTDWNTVVTVCTHCGPTPTTVTLTLPSIAPVTVKTPVTNIASTVSTANTPLAPIADATPGKWSSSSSTFHIRPTGSASRVHVAASGTQRTAPVFTGAAARIGFGKGFSRFAGFVLVVLVSAGSV